MCYYTVTLEHTMCPHVQLCNTQIQGHKSVPAEYTNHYPKLMTHSVHEITQV